MQRPSTRSRRLVGALVALALLGTLGAPATPAAADQHPPGASMGASWLAGQIGPEGFIASGENADVGATLDVALSLAAAGVDASTFLAITEWMTSHIETVIGATDATANPGRTAVAMIILDAAGLDPAEVETDLGTLDLVAVLEGTLDELDPGLYGGASPNFDGVFRQSLAILALDAVGATVPEAAVVWLEHQQCSEPSSALGGWEAYRGVDPGALCEVPDPATFSGPDTNQTAMAVQALSATRGAAAFEVQLGLDFLEDAQALDGGFPYLTGSGPGDPNSTSVVIGALVAAGEDPLGERWTLAPGVDPLASLLGWQLGCDSEAPGAFTSPFSAGAADLFASRQAVLGASLQSYQVSTPQFGPIAEPCAVTFDDVNLDQQFNVEISWLVGNGIAEGYADDTFRPAAPVSRQATAAFLARFDALSSGVEPPACTEAPFVDVAVDHPFCAEIAWLVDNGITQGYADDTFRPTAPLSRQATAAFLARLSLI